MLAEPLLLLHTPTHAAQLEIVEALTKDATDVLNERVNGTFADDANPSDNELELAGTENVESEGGRRLAPPPPFSELSSLFGPLEKYAQSCGISGAAYHLRKAPLNGWCCHAMDLVMNNDKHFMFLELFQLSALLLVHLKNCCRN